MKIRSKVYKDIRDKLLAEMPELQFVDLQKGQMSNKEQNYPIPLPACLVEIRPAQWSNATGGQLGDATISLYLYLDLVTDSFDAAERENETIDILDNLDRVYEVMEGFDGVVFHPLNRIADAIVEYGKRYVCYRTDFKTTFIHDDPAQIVEQKPKVKFKF